VAPVPSSDRRDEEKPRQGMTPASFIRLMLILWLALAVLAMLELG
jgi:hypothetical protein